MRRACSYNQLSVNPVLMMQLAVYFPSTIIGYQYQVYSDSTKVHYTHTIVDHNEHESNPKRAAVLFVLKTREEGRLTQRVLNQVVLV